MYHIDFVVRMASAPIQQSMGDFASRARESSRARTLIVAAFIALWFLAQGWRGLFVYFSPDDVMNMYWAFDTPVRKLLLSNIDPFTTAYRPLVAAVYRILFAIFGFHPLPFRITVYALLLLNIVLVYKLARCLTGSPEIAILAAFLSSFHRRFTDIYLNNGTIYDVLCGTLYLTAMLLYIGARQSGSQPSVRRWIAVYLFALGALNAKETAATLALALILYELIYAPPHRSSLGAILLALLLAISAATILVRLRPESRLANNEAYKLHIGVKQFLETSGANFDNLFCLPGGAFQPSWVVIAFAAALTIAFVSRLKHLQFLALFALVAPLPVNFITTRALYASYIATFGWAIYFASLLVNGRDWMYHRFWRRPKLPVNTFEPERVLLFAFTAAVLLLSFSFDGPMPWFEADQARSPVFHLRSELLRLHPTLPKKAKLILMDDPFDAGDWIPLMTARLTYHDRDLKLERVKMMLRRPTPRELASYDYAFDYGGNRLVPYTP